MRTLAKRVASSPHWRLASPRVTADRIPCRRFATSVSSREVDKFSSLDNDWWDATKNPLIHLNSIRVQYIQDMVARHLGPSDHGSSEAPAGSQRIQKQGRGPLQGIQALDIGCGGGLACESLARLGATVTGVDPSESLIQAAKRHSQLDPRTQSIHYIGGRTAEDLALQQPSSFDVICLLEVIEHATDVQSLVQATSDLLKPNGLLFVSTINRTVKSYFLTILGAEYVMRYIPVGTHDWTKYLSPEEVNRLASAASMTPLDATGMVLAKPPLLGTWDWKLAAHDLDVNWIGTYVKHNNV